MGPDTTVQPWRPILASPNEVEAWREWLLDRRIRQPFKQAFREVYRLAPQEADGTSSSRFAGRVLIFMPFEDKLLGHILASALLLAEDAKIWDDTIRLQIRAD